jgi:hypothetical protein
MKSAPIPPPILKRRERLCGDCSCGVDKHDACAVCPQGKWKRFFCEESFSPPPPEISSNTPPSLADMVKSATASMATWARKGFATTDEDTLKTRLETCYNCEYWNSKSFGGSGRCMKCGCSTWFKLRMATEKCPIDRW